MNSAGSEETVLFEPWNLGDVIIAASTLRELPYPAALACNPRWHPLLRSALSPRRDVTLIPIELAYTTRNRAHALEFNSEKKDNAKHGARLVFSIRGDLRDYFAARKIFPHARIRMIGWIRFFARKSTLIDLPYSLGLLSVQNRYYSWATLVGLSYAQIESTYYRLRADAPKNRKVVIHLGAQWRSKQFPYVMELRSLLRSKGYEVVLVATSSDLLPPGISPDEVLHAENEDLINAFRSAEFVICNDSGPMHLAAFLGCRTTVIVRTSSIEEWLPPLTRVVAAVKTPKGYRQKKHYMSDEILPDWPSPSKVLQAFDS